MNKETAVLRKIPVFATCLLCSVFPPFALPDQVEWGFAQCDPVEGFLVHGRVLEQDDL